MSQIFAQGDILIERVSDVAPSGEIITPALDGATVLAEGEVTGHRHAIRDHVTFFRDDGLARDMPQELYVGHLKVGPTTGPVRLVHEEHDAIMLAPGTYRVRRQRQVEPNNVELVMD
jgi:hypothetical protein